MLQSVLFLLFFCVNYQSQRIHQPSKTDDDDDATFGAFNQQNVCIFCCRFKKRLYKFECCIMHAFLSDFNRVLSDFSISFLKWTSTKVVFLSLLFCDCMYFCYWRIHVVISIILTFDFHQMITNMHWQQPMYRCKNANEPKLRIYASNFQHYHSGLNGFEFPIKTTFSAADKKVELSKCTEAENRKTRGTTECCNIVKADTICSSFFSSTFNIPQSSYWKLH